MQNNTYRHMLLISTLFCRHFLHRTQLHWVSTWTHKIAHPTTHFSIESTFIIIYSYIMPTCEESGLWAKGAFLAQSTEDLWITGTSYLNYICSYSLQWIYGFDNNLTLLSNPPSATITHLTVIEWYILNVIDPQTKPCTSNAFFMIGQKHSPHQLDNLVTN